jgi:hypothetical protein
MLEPWILHQNPFKRKSVFFYQKKAVAQADLPYYFTMESVIRALGFKSPVV